MNNTRSPENLWRKQKAKLKLRFSHLDDDDLNYDYGMRDVMMSKLQIKLGKTREELNTLLSRL